MTIIKEQGYPALLNHNLPPLDLETWNKYINQIFKEEFITAAAPQTGFMNIKGYKLVHQTLALGAHVDRLPQLIQTFFIELENIAKGSKYFFMRSPLELSYDVRNTSYVLSVRGSFPDRELFEDYTQGLVKDSKLDQICQTH